MAFQEKTAWAAARRAVARASGREPRTHPAYWHSCSMLEQLTSTAVAAVTGQGRALISWLGSLLGILTLVGWLASWGEPSQAATMIAQFFGFSIQENMASLHDWLNNPTRRDTLIVVLQLYLALILASYARIDSQVLTQVTAIFDMEDKNESNTKFEQYTSFISDRKAKLTASIWIIVGLLAEMNAIVAVGAITYLFGFLVMTSTIVIHQGRKNGGKYYSIHDSSQGIILLFVGIVGQGVIALAFLPLRTYGLLT